MGLENSASPGLHVGERKREVARAEIHAAEGFAAFSGSGPENPSGATPGRASATLAPLRLSFRLLRWRGWGRAPLRLHATKNSRAQVPPGLEVLHLSSHLSINCPTSPTAEKANRPISNIQGYQKRMLNGRSRTPTDPTAWPGAHWLHTPLGPRLRYTRAYLQQRGGAGARRLPIGCQSSRVVSRSLSGPMGITTVERPASLERWRSCFLR